MRSFIFALGLAALAVPAGAQDASPFAADRPPLFDPVFETPTQDADLVERGRIIASGGTQRGGVGMKCMACHGLQGQGARTGAVPKLSGLSAGYLTDQLHAYQRGTRSSRIMMPIAGGLQADEINAVTAYYASLDAEPRTDLPEADTALVQQGGAIAATGISTEKRNIAACTDCHANGESTSGAGVPMLAGQHATYIAEQLRKWQEGTRMNDALNVMSGIAKQLTDEEIEAVSLYYERVRPE